MFDYFAVEYSLASSLPLDNYGELVLVQLGSHESICAATSLAMATLGATKNIRTLIIKDHQRWVVFDEHELRQLKSEGLYV